MDDACDAGARADKWIMCGSISIRCLLAHLYKVCRTSLQDGGVNERERTSVPYTRTNKEKDRCSTR